MAERQAATHIHTKILAYCMLICTEQEIITGWLNLLMLISFKEVTNRYYSNHYCHVKESVPLSICCLMCDSYCSSWLVSWYTQKPRELNDSNTLYRKHHHHLSAINSTTPTCSYHSFTYTLLMHLTLEYVLSWELEHCMTCFAMAFRTHLYSNGVL